MAIRYLAPPPLNCDAVRAFDRFGIETLGVPGMVLMENAGAAAAELIYERLADPAQDAVVMLCGAGNNGGDGFVIARHLANAGVPVTVVRAVPAERLQGDARTNSDIVMRLHLPEIDASDVAEPAFGVLAAAAIIVDALLGTGAHGAPRGTFAQLIELANAAPHAQRVAIDVPSGLDADTGEVYEPCFRAALTVTMAAPKIGFTRGGGPEVTGSVVTVGIGVPPPPNAPATPENSTRSLDS